MPSAKLNFAQGAQHKPTDQEIGPDKALELLQGRQPLQSGARLDADAEPEQFSAWDGAQQPEPGTVLEVDLQTAKIVKWRPSQDCCPEGPEMRRSHSRENRAYASTIPLNAGSRGCSSQQR